MHNLQLTIPAPDTTRPGARIKPREVKAWLDDLPFLDLQRAAQLAHEQLHRINRQALPCSSRLEILGAFLATYQRLTDALGTAAQDDSQHLVPKRLCQDIGFGYKIVAHELVNRNNSFLAARHLPLALLGAIHTLGLQLLDAYISYRRAPRSLWSECLALYAYAWQTGRTQYSALLPGFGEQQIDASFRLISVLRLANPLGLPAGTVTAMRAYFAQRIRLSAIHQACPAQRNCFQLQQAAQPPDQDPDLYLDLDQLLEPMRTDIARLTRQRQPRAIGLPSEVPVTSLLRALQQTLDHWTSNPERIAPREDILARIELVSGLDAAYCMINQGRCFDPGLFMLPGQDHSIDLGARPGPDNETTGRSPPIPFTCTCVNRSNGGLSLRGHGLEASYPRVGQLVALRRSGLPPHSGWVVGVCRWLVRPDGAHGFELGLQYLARAPQPVVIRVTDSDGTSGDYQAAICAIQKRGDQRVHTLIANSGEIRTGSLVTIFQQGRQQRVRCSELLESGPGFDRYIYSPV